MWRLFPILLAFILWPSLAKAQIEPNVLRIGNFEIEKMGADLKKNMLYIELPSYRINTSLKLPKINTSNYRQPVNMADIAQADAARQKENKSHKLLQNIRITYGEYNKDGDESGKVKVNSNIFLDANPYGSCPHGRNRSFCSICSPHNLHNRNPFFNNIGTRTHSLYFQPYIYH